MINNRYHLYLVLRFFLSYFNRLTNVVNKSIQISIFLLCPSIVVMLYVSVLSYLEHGEQGKPIPQLKPSLSFPFIYQ